MTAVKRSTLADQGDLLKDKSPDTAGMTRHVVNDELTVRDVKSGVVRFATG